MIGCIASAMSLLDGGGSHPIPRLGRAENPFFPFPQTPCVQEALPARPSARWKPSSVLPPRMSCNATAQTSHGPWTIDSTAYAHGWLLSGISYL